MNIIFSLDEINEVAQQIVAQNPNKVILFHGEMGVGKTTLIKALAKTLGVNGTTSSPTFSLVNVGYKISVNFIILKAIKMAITKFKCAAASFN